MISIHDLKPRFQASLRPILRGLRRLGVTPTLLTLLALAPSFAVTGSILHAQPAHAQPTSPVQPKPGGDRTGAALELLEKSAGETPYEKVKNLYDQGSMPKSPDDLKGWFAGRWIENAQPPALKGSLLGIEGVSSRREEPGSDEAMILATWSDELPSRWDPASPADLTRSQEMLRRGPRDGAIVFDEAEKAAVILGRYEDGKFRYAYSIREIGPSIVIRYDYERRRISFGYFFKRIMGPGASH